MVTSAICWGYLSFELPDVVAKVNPAVVQIEVRNEYGRGWSGSGVIVHEHGLILTAKHIIKDVDDIEVTLADGRVYKVADTITDPNNDIGIIHIAPLEDLPVAELGSGVRVGEEIFIIGSPFGLYNSVALGIVAGRNRSILYFGTEPMLQLDVAGNPGNSGSGIFNFKGELAGILVGRISNADGINFAASSDACKLLVEKYVGVQNDRK